MPTTTKPECFYLRKGEHSTLEFTYNKDGTVDIMGKHTLDPDEECEVEFLGKEEARKKWKEAVADGYKKVSGWHTDKARHPWDHDSGD